MTYNLPLRRTTLHLAQRLLIDGETFMISNLLTCTATVCSCGATFDAVCTAKVLIIYVPCTSVQRNDEAASGAIGQSGREDRLR